MPKYYDDAKALLLHLKPFGVGNPVPFADISMPAKDADMPVEDFKEAFDYAVGSKWIEHHEGHNKVSLTPEGLDQF